ncbi:molybdopterin-binding protein [Deferribacter autotrophicus]|uniref:Molybdopterin molybdenumtransferase n=1 Tax=Deferribacter autotrophicus TaxID=500465 RepID=A0A5A8F5W0_9BACT|nr:molybdopterin-binding protein [Deferribacter autotrophicus]KAA0259514.1 molybdopterin-binding protein [Deferribacter autotrophicus]
MFRKVKVEDAVGFRLAHDITEVNLEKKFKGVAFKRGYLIKKEDIERLKSLGKYYVFVLDEINATDFVHEDDAATELAPYIAGENIFYDEQPSEGKINFYATTHGLLKIDKQRVISINKLKIPSLPTKHSNIPVKKGDTVAAFRIIPLYCEKELVAEVKKILSSPAIKVVPYKLKSAGIIVTGNEIYNGKIKDKFYPLMESKLKEYGLKITDTSILPDDKEIITAEIKIFLKKVDILFITGGTSVDPDDNTKLAIKEAGVNIVQEGNPIQPGNNFTIGYFDDIPVCAVPAAALYYRATALDIFLPRLLAGEQITADEIAEYSVGGLCHFCKVCVFPVCPFGKV